MNLNLEMDRPYLNNADSVLVTTNYYYNSKICIGQGATSCVYKGQHRVTGEEMALKISKQNGLHREVEREIEAFLLLRHENIVSFYGVEEDVQSGKHVIVMEYCAGGSLFSFLQEPENKRGLPDSEFLILLKDLRRATEKLNSCGFIHRDIKPGNVLRALDRTGKSVYKISDFGSARQLESDDHCVSLAGTEEYLHPLVYEKAFINRSPVIVFKHSMDRWSLGATLCHAATGDVPFKPSGGARKNRSVMFQMLSKKPSGKIRCTQDKTSGKIIWFDDLPLDCNMTDGLRTRVVPIIAGLMEKDERKQWTSATFIHEVDIIMESVVISVLNTDTCSYHTLYMDPHNTFAYIAENIAAQTEIPSARQKYFIDNKPKDCLVPPSVTVKELPSSSTEKSMICVFLTECDESTFNENVQRFTFPDAFILSEDCKVASELLINMHSILKKVSETVQAQADLTHFVKEYRAYMNKCVETIETEYTKDVMISTEKLTRFQQITDTISISGTTNDFTINQKYQDLSNKGFEMKKLIEFIKCEIFEIKRLQQNTQENENFLQLKLCSSECISVIEYIFSQAKDVVMNMCKRRKNSYLTHIEEVRHRNDKKKLIKYFDSVSRQWKNCCNTKSQTLAKNFKIWMRYQNKVQENSENVREHMMHLQSLTRSFNNELTTFSAYSGREWSMMVSSEKWKSLLRQKDDSAVKLMNEGRNLMKSLSVVLQKSNLDKIGDIEWHTSLQGT